MYTLPWSLMYAEHPVATPGMSILGDAWGEANWSKLIAGDALDEEYFGTKLRYEVNDYIPSLPVKIEFTGKVVYTHGGMRWMRVRITTWASDDEQSVFYGKLMLENYNG